MRWLMTLWILAFGLVAPYVGNAQEPTPPADEPAPMSAEDPPAVAEGESPPMLLGEAGATADTQSPVDTLLTALKAVKSRRGADEVGRIAQALRNIDSTVQSDWTAKIYTALVDATFQGLQQRRSIGDEWQPVLDLILSLSSEAAEADDATPPVERIRRLLNGDVAKALAADEVRRGGDGPPPSDADLDLTDAVIQIINGSLIGAGVAGPGLDLERNLTAKRLLDRFGEVEGEVQTSWTVEVYEAFLERESEIAFSHLQGRSLEGWRNGRDLLLAELNRRANGDLREYRRLVRGPIRRALEYEVARVEGITQRDPLGSMTTSQLKAMLNQKSGSMTKKDHKWCPLYYLVP